MYFRIGVKVRREPRHRLLAFERDVDVPYPVVVELDWKPGTAQTERGKELACLRKRRDGRDRLAHPAEAGAAPPLLKRNRNDSGPGFEADLVELAHRAEDECRAEHRMAGEPELGCRREDADPRVATGFGRVDEHRLREVDLPREWLEHRLRDVSRVREDGELVARERTIGEDIADDVGVNGHVCLPSTTPERAVGTGKRGEPPSPGRTGVALSDPPR